MEIIRIGHASFRLRYKNVFVITDPYDPKDVGLDFPQRKADIVTISHDHSDHNHLDRIQEVKKVIDGPGEYEVSDVSILGFSTYHDDKKGEERGKNTIYVFEFGMTRVAHLGDLGHELKDKTLEKMGDIDVLLIPVGGKYTIGPDEAVKIVQAIEPLVVIPMHYKEAGMNEQVFGELEKVDEFVKEIGIPAEKMQKFDFKKSSLGEDQRLIILERK